LVTAIAVVAAKSAGASKAQAETELVSAS